MVKARSDGGQGAAVLCSGGLDRAVLLADVAGLLVTPPLRGVLPLATLRFDMRDVYPPTHWAIRGEPPGFDTPDEDVYL